MNLRYAAAHATWTDARVALLKQLWSEGASCSQIAAALGDVTRSAVIGKVHRLSLPRPARKPPVERPKRAARQANRPSPRSALSSRLDQFNAAIPIAQRRTLLHLTRSTCRWPVGQPDQPEFFFCGGRVEEGRPYCSGHCDFAYQREKGPCPRSTYATARRAPEIDHDARPEKKSERHPRPHRKIPWRTPKYRSRSTR